MKPISLRDLAGATILPGLPFNPSKRNLTRTMDAQITLDQATIDSAGAFLVGELERLDQTLNMPLYANTWSRDVPLRDDVQLGDEQSSYTTSTFGNVGGIVPSGISWVGKNSTAIPRIQANIQKVINDLTPWADVAQYSVFDVASAQVTGRPLETTYQEGINLKLQIDTDHVVYIGDTSIGAYGLLNQPLITNTGNVVNGAGGSPLWSLKTPAEILNDVNTLLVSVWTASGYAQAPTRLLLPPVQYGYIVTTIINIAGGNMSILKYLRENNVMTAQFGVELEILPCKWLAANTIPGVTVNRMFAYTPDKKFVRFPMVPIQSLPIQYKGVFLEVNYFGKLGRVECPYPETLASRDGI